MVAAVFRDVVETVVCAGEEPAPYRRIGHKAHAKFAARLDVSSLGVATPQRVLHLQRDDRMNFVGASNGCSTCLGQRNISRLTLLHETRHTANGFFDRHIWVNSRHTEDIQSLDAQTLEAVFALLNQVFRLAAAAVATRIRSARAAGLGVNYDSFPPPFKRLGDQLVIMAVAVTGRGVEKINSQIESAVQSRDGLGVISRSIGAGHTHAADPHWRNFEFSCAKL